MNDQKSRRNERRFNIVMQGLELIMKDFLAEQLEYEFKFIIC